MVDTATPSITNGPSGFSSSCSRRAWRPQDLHARQLVHLLYKCVLANEEVVNGVCERCGSEVIRKEKSQWMLKITEYAQRLIDDLDQVDFIERVKIQQKNWIGRSTGAEVTFPTTQGMTWSSIPTRPDTPSLAPPTWYSRRSTYRCPVERRHRQLGPGRRLCGGRGPEVDFERTELAKKTGVKLEGVAGINPVNGKKIPISSRTMFWCPTAPGDHGGAGPRRPGLGICREVWL